MFFLSAVTTWAPTWSLAEDEKLITKPAKDFSRELVSPAKDKGVSVAGYCETAVVKWICGRCRGRVGAKRNAPCLDAFRGIPRYRKTWVFPSPM